MSEMTMEVAARVTGVAGEVTANDLAQWIACGPSPMIFDLRESSSYDDGHIPGSEHASLFCAGEMVQRIPDDGLTVLVCEDGRRSREAARLLNTCGFRQVAWLRGGIAEWNDEGNQLM
jgi:rhodanese-related sulfurtransferase